MGRSVDVHKYNYPDLIAGIAEYVGTSDAELIEKVLLECGSVVGDSYIILNNEFWEDVNPYYNVANALNTIYAKSEAEEDELDVFGEVFCTIDDKFGHRYLTSHTNIQDELAEVVRGDL